MSDDSKTPDLFSGKSGQSPADGNPSADKLFSDHTASHHAGATVQQSDSFKVGPSSPPSSIPSELGRFHHIEVVKSGGFGIVCRAQDSQAGRLVALKFPRQEKLRDQSDLKMFVDEANRAMELDHPGIVKTYAVEETDGLLAIVQEFIEGSDLKAQQKGMTDHQVIATLIAKIADALGYAHRRGIFHRDLKPANILLDQQGNPYITDFGLAMHEREQLFLPKQRCGTPHYMPPEQVAGLTRRLDGRSDIWSLGVILYELLTKRKPFQGTDEQEIYDQIEHNDPRPPRQVDPTIDRELQRICLKCLERQQRDRYPTADDLAEDLRHWVANPTPDPSKAGQRFVPRGLRAFTNEDADFFLELIPGSRDRNGLPTSVKFWLNRIVLPTPMDLVTPLGVVFGPSGSGKSSFVRAGLLPLLSPDIVTVVVDCTVVDTEGKLLKLLSERLEGVPGEIGLIDLCAGLAQGLWRPKAKSKVLIVLDQLEQRLSRGDDFMNADLVRALRYCDGRTLQALLLCRDDFYMHLSRFADSLGMDLREGDNAQAIDLFDRRHARKILIKYGQAFGQLPDQAVELTSEQEEFLQAVITELAVADFVVCVQLVLFAEMFRDRSWTLAELQNVGGVLGIGEKFLETTFGNTARDKRLRSQGAVAQKILEALLPPMGSDIRSGSKSEAELRTAAGLDSDTKRFQAVIKSLDSQLKLITRVETVNADQTSPPDATGLPSVVFQLTHDSMIASIRSWLERQSRHTRAGRASQRLRELGQQVLPNQPPRYLPTHVEWLSWQWLLRSKKRTTAEEVVWKAAGKRFWRDFGVAAAVLLVFGLIGSVWAAQSAYSERVRLVETNIDKLLRPQFDTVASVLSELDNERELALPRLRSLYDSHLSGSPTRIGAALGLLPYDQNMQDELVAAVLAPDTLPKQLEAIVKRLDLTDQSGSTIWSPIYQDTTQDTRRRFRAFVAEVNSCEPSPEWAQHSAAMAAAFGVEPRSTLDEWLKLLQPARAALLPQFQALFVNEHPAAEPLALGIMALSPTKDAAVQYLVSHLPKWKTPQFEAAMNTISRRGYAAEFVPVAQQRLASETDPWARAILCVALARCDTLEPLLDLYSQDSESAATIYAVNASIPGRLNPNVLRQLYQQQNLAQFDNTNLRRSVLLAYCLQAPSLVDTIIKAWLEEVAFHHTVNDPDACCFSAAELIMRHLGHDPTLVGRAERRANSDKNGILGNVLIDQTGLAFSLFANPESEDESQWIAVCTTELTHEEILDYLAKNPDQITRLGGPKSPNDVTDFDVNPIAKAPFLHRRRGNDLALVFEYCNWLSRENGLAPTAWSYPAEFSLQEINDVLVNRNLAGFRLPTVKEWQLANRCSESLLKLATPEGPVLWNYAWSFENSRHVNKTVGYRLPNAAGLFDMFGNVEEICHSMPSDGIGFFSMGQTIRADVSTFNNEPVGVGVGAVVPANHLYMENNGFRIARHLKVSVEADTKSDHFNEE